MSRKASIAMAGVSAIAASDDIGTQAMIGIVVVSAVIAQAVLDWKGGRS